MSRVLLVPPSRSPSPLREALARAGHEVVVAESLDAEALLAACDPAPDVIAVDLDRAPATGRDVALWLVGRKAFRATPVAFVGGKPEFVARTRPLVPGATFTDRRDLPAAVRAALRAPRPRTTRPPATALAGYSGTPLPRKLGIRPGSAVVLLGAPGGFAATLGDLPEGARLGARGEGDVVVLFARSRKDLARRLDAAERAMADGGRLWICWPKQASGVETDLSERVVRERGLAAGLVDYKIAAIDATWAGLCFARRKGT